MRAAATPPAGPWFTTDRRGMLRRDGGVLVLHLQGTDEEMARQHAELLADEIRVGALPFMAGFLSRSVGGAGPPLRRLGTALLGRGLDLLCTRVARNTPVAERRAFFVAAAAAGLRPADADLAIGLPDALVILIELAARLHGLGARLPLPRRSSPLACSGAVALPEVTADRHLLHARNLDYDGLGTFDRFPTVAFCRPRGGLPYAWIASAGVHTAGLTGMNAAGLFLGSNTAPTTDVSLRGECFFALNDPVVRQARTLGEAVDLLGRRRAASGYAVHLSHGPSRDALIVEYSASRRRVRGPRGGLLCATNHYLDPEMARTTPTLGLVDAWNTHGRHDRLRARLAGARGRIDVPFLVDCVRDQVELRTGQRRPFGDVVCNYLTIGSVVADVTAGRLWVAADAAPAALGRYVAFDLHRELDAFGQPRAYPPDELPASAAATGASAAASHEVQAAHLALCQPDGEAAAYAHVQAAAARCPDDPRLRLQQALLGLKLDRREAAGAHARGFLAAASADEPRRHRAHLILAWCADLDGRPVDARFHHDAAAIAARGHPQSAAEVRAWRGRRFTARDRRALHVDLYNARRFPL